MQISLPADVDYYDSTKENEKLTLLIYPWDTSVPTSLLPARPALGFPMSVNNGSGTALVPADLKLPTTSAVFAIQYSYNPPMPPGTPKITVKTMICKTGLVRVKDKLPSKLLVLQLPEPTEVDLSILDGYLKSQGNNWVGMVPHQDPIRVEDGLAVIYILLTGFIGTMSGNARVYVSVRPSQMPDPGRYLELELEDTEGSGLIKGAFEKVIRNDILPGVEKTVNGYVTDAIDENIGPLDSLAELATENRAITSSRGVMLRNFKLGMTVKTSAYVAYPVA